MRAPLAGGPATSLAANLPCSAPIALALDVDHIYWRNLEGKVKRASKAGGEPTSVQTGAGFATAIAVDEVDLYFVVTENSTLGPDFPRNGSGHIPGHELAGVLRRSR